MLIRRFRLGAACAKLSMIVSLFCGVPIAAQVAPDSFAIDNGTAADVQFEYLPGYRTGGNYDADVIYRVEYGVNNDGSQNTSLPTLQGFSISGESFLPLAQSREVAGQTVTEPFDEAIPIRLIDGQTADQLQLCSTDNVSGTSCADVANRNKNSFYQTYTTGHRDQVALQGPDVSAQCAQAYVDFGVEPATEPPECPIVRFQSERVVCFKCIANSYEIDRGSDNIFSKQGGSTRNNIGRLDLIIQNPVEISTADANAFDSTNPQSILDNVGFLVMERGGNDNISLAAITQIDSLDDVADTSRTDDLARLARLIRSYDNPSLEGTLIAPGRSAQSIVTALGPLTQTVAGGFSGTSCSGSFWGDTGDSSQTSVFMNANDGSFMENRPVQDLGGSQSICGTFVSLAQLGVGLDQPFYGVSIFAGDVTASMDLITLTDVPRDTSAASGGAGGLDLMGGGGFFFRNDVPALVSIEKALTGEAGAMDGVAEPGEQLTYTITLTNSSIADATGFDLTDQLDPNTSFLSASDGGVASSGVVTWTGLTIPATQSVQLTVVVEVNGSIPEDVDTITNLVYEAGTNPPACPGSQCVQTPTPPTLDILKQLTAESGTIAGFAEAGEELTYTITLINSGGSDLTGLDLSDRIDPNVVIDAGDEAVLTQGAVVSVVGPDTFVTWQDLVVPANDSLQLPVRVTVSDPLPDGANQIVNLVYRTGDDPLPACPGDQCVQTPTAVPRLSLEKAVEPATYFLPGTPLDYTFTVTNSGNTTISDLAIADPLPGLTPASCAQVVLASGASTTCTAQYVTTTNDADTARTIENTAVATGVVEGDLPVESDPDTAVVTYFAPPEPPGLVIAKALVGESGERAGLAEPGETLTYSITVSNTGGSQTTAFDLTDMLDSNTRFQSATGGGVESGGLVNWSVRPIQPGVSRVFEVVVVVDEVLAPDVERVTNLVYETGAQPPACPGAQCVQTPVAPVVSVLKSADPASGSAVSVDQAITYTLTASVANNSTSDTLVLTDSLDPGLTFGEVAGNPGGFAVGGTDTSPVFTLAAGSSVGEYAISYTAVVNETAEGSVGNQVVASGGDDPGCASCATSHPVDARVTVAKRSDPVSGSLVSAGTEIVYTLSVDVLTGPTTDAVRLEDALDAGLEFVGIESAGEFSVATTGQPLVFTLPAGRANGSYTVRYRVRVTDAATGAVDNVVVASGDDDPTCADCATQHPVMAFEVLGAACVADTPFVDYSLQIPGVADPQITVTWFAVDEAGNETREVDSLQTGEPTGRLLWPGASIRTDGNGHPVLDENGNPIPTQWPGWERDADGNWFQVATDLRPQIGIRFEVNPQLTAVLGYPPPQPTCNAAPQRGPGPEAVPVPVESRWLVLSLIALTLLSGLWMTAVRARVRAL